MSAAAPQSHSTVKVRNHRSRLREQGLRPVQMWLPDTRTAAFHKAAATQARAIADSAYEAEDQAFLDALSEGA